MSGTYVTNITHYLDDEGEIVATIPAPARKLASFLVLLIDSITSESLPTTLPSEIRCRKRGCYGQIIISLDDITGPINWQCSQCDHHGIISQWQGSKWDNRHAAD
jgi:hypothetical protein